MSDSDSSDCVFVRTNSLKGHKAAPKDENYKIKIKPEGSVPKAILYTLKEGQHLPYSPILEGFVITFGQDLKPSMGSGWSCEQKKDTWVFKGILSVFLLLIYLHS